MHIALSRDEILCYAQKYAYDGEDVVAAALVKARERGFMTREDLVVVAKWKWKGGRTRGLVLQNSEEDVTEITKTSFATTSERLRVGALISLRGVNWPMASTILHFAFRDKYPILDERAMRTVGGSTLYTFESWTHYTELCRTTAQQMKIGLRTLDRALWAFDKARSLGPSATRNENLKSALTEKLARLLEEDEAGWRQAAEWIDRRALDKGFDLATDYTNAKAFARSIVEGMRIHIDYQKRFPQGLKEIERHEVAEELFWQIMPPHA